MHHPIIKPLLMTAGITMIVLGLFSGLALSTNSDTAPNAAGEMSKAVLTVEGMTCSGCVYTIKNSLASFEGITDVQVDVSAGSTEILYDSSQHPNADEMAAAISASGYPAKVVRILTAEQVREMAKENQVKAGSAIAAVSGLDIPRAHFEAELAHARSRYQTAYGPEALTSDQGRRLLDQVKAQIARRLIDETIQLQEVRRSGFTVDPNSVKKEYQAFWRERGFSDADAFEEELRRSSYAPEYFMKRFENRVLINTYIDQRVITTNLNDIEKRQRYAEWFGNARLLADVTYYDKDLERLIIQKSSAGGCGNSCSVKP